MELLKFVFQSFGHFLGFLILLSTSLSIVGTVILKLAAIINIRKVGEYLKDDKKSETNN